MLEHGEQKKIICRAGGSIGVRVAYSTLTE